MRTFLKNVGIILVLVVGISSLISVGSLWALRQSDFYKPSFLVNSVKESRFDYIILGASTGLTTLNTQLIDSINHTKGVNLSMDDTSLPSQYLMLQHFLAQGKTTRFCVLAPSNASFDSKHNRLSDNDYRFLPFVNASYVYDYYNSFSGTSSNILGLSRWMPELGVSYYNAELFYPSLLSLINPKKRNRFDVHGNYEYPFIKYQDSTLVTFEPMPIQFTNIYLLKIMELCRANNIELICYLTPMMDKQVILEPIELKVINHSNLLMNAKYFNDAIHVNYLGNRQASVRFADDIQTYLNTK